MTQVNKESLGTLLRAAMDRKTEQENKRTAKGQLKRYSAYRLAKEAKIDHAHAYRLLSGNVAPSREILVRVCRALGCTQQEINEIFALTDYRPPSEDEEIEDEHKHPAA